MYAKHYSTVQSQPNDQNPGSSETVVNIICAVLFSLLDNNPISVLPPLHSLNECHASISTLDVSPSLIRNLCETLLTPPSQ
mmetsp:Transcript_5287/g.9637  ORF Transcript_5287/g.9637 Transcript_5287/m.9637 type:complete len:81 (-) Transcript_5287:10-252(-)